jgi:hypothetical protein
MFEPYRDMFRGSLYLEIITTEQKTFMCRFILLFFVEISIGSR